MWRVQWLRSIVGEGWGEMTEQQWWVRRESMTLGPYGLDEMRRHVTRGKVGPNDVVCAVGTDAWLPASEAPRVRDLFLAAIPVSASVPPPRPRGSPPSRVPGVPSPFVQPPMTNATGNDRWFVHRDGVVLGPFPITDLRAHHAEGRLQDTDTVATEGSDEWCPITALLSTSSPPLSGPRGVTSAPTVNGSQPSSRPSPASAPNESIRSEPEAPVLVAIASFSTPTTSDTVVPASKQVDLPLPSSWRDAFDEAIALPCTFSRDQLESELRRHMGKFEGTPSDFPAAVHFDLRWIWLPVVLAEADFEGSWTGEATPFRYVERATSSGSTRTERDYGYPQSFEGSLPTFRVTVALSGDATVVPDELLPTRKEDVRELFDPTQSDAVVIDSLADARRSDLPALPEAAVVAELRVAPDDASERLVETATELAEERAEEVLESRTSGCWGRQSSAVDISPSDDDNPVLFLLPVLAGTYRYRNRQWQAVAMASTAYVSVAGVPEGVLNLIGRALGGFIKLLCVLGIVAAAAEGLRSRGFIERGVLPWDRPRAAHLDPEVQAQLPLLVLKLNELNPVIQTHVRNAPQADGSGSDVGPPGVGPRWISWDFGRAVRVTHVRFSMIPANTSEHCGIRRARLLGPDGTAVPIAMRGPNIGSFEGHVSFGTGRGFVVSLDRIIDGSPGQQCGMNLTLNVEGHLVDTQGIVSATWRTRASDVSNQGRGSLAVYCPPGGQVGSVLGTDNYAIESSVCSAAVHSYGFTTALGGITIVQFGQRMNSFVGSTRNGVTSQSRTEPAQSFSFPPRGGAVMSANTPVLPVH